MNKDRVIVNVSDNVRYIGQILDGDRWVFYDVDCVSMLIVDPLTYSIINRSANYICINDKRINEMLVEQIKVILMMM